VPTVIFSLRENAHTSPANTSPGHRQRLPKQRGVLHLGLVLLGVVHDMSCYCIVSLPLLVLESLPPACLTRPKRKLLFYE
jgi:hypothetical protein